MDLILIILCMYNPIFINVKLNKIELDVCARDNMVADLSLFKNNSYDTLE